MPAAQALDAATRRSLALLLAGALIPLAGCTSGDDGGPSSEGGGSGASRDVPHLDREQVASGGTLHWAVDSLPPTLNAFRPKADATTERITGATLPSLFTLDAAARPQLNPDYVEAADVTSEEPRQTVVYRLNPKAKWSSGRSIGVADFKAQWKALSGRKKSFDAARNAGYDRIGKVTKGKNAREVKVVFRKPYADWKSLFTPLYPRSVMARADDFNHAAHRSLPVSAGPFRVEKIHRGDTSVKLVRNKKWWGDDAKLKRIVLRVVPRDERKEALRRGQLDLAEVDVATVRSIVRAHKGGEEDAKSRKGNEQGRKSTEELRAQAERDGKLRHLAVRHAFEPAYTQLALNGAEGPLSDERVRRAVARAIDREAIAKRALRGTGLPVKALGSHLRMIDQDGYADNSDALGEQDVESAQSLLAEAGWKDGGARSESTAGADAKKGDRGNNAEGDKNDGGKDSKDSDGGKDSKAGNDGKDSSGDKNDGGKDSKDSDGGKDSKAGNDGKDSSGDKNDGGKDSKDSDGGKDSKAGNDGKDSSGDKNDGGKDSKDSDGGKDSKAGNDGKDSSGDKNDGGKDSKDSDGGKDSKAGNDGKDSSGDKNDGGKDSKDSDGGKDSKAGNDGKDSSGDKNDGGKDSKDSDGGKDSKAGNDGKDSSGDKNDGGKDSKDSDGGKDSKAGNDGKDSSGDKNDGDKNAQQSSAQNRAAGAAPGVAPVSVQEAARLAAQPLTLSPATAGQRASLMTQAARLQLRKAEASGSEGKVRKARAAVKQATRARADADELRLLSDGGAKVQRTKAGKPLTLRLVLPKGPGSDSIRATGTRIAKALTRIGVRTQVKQVPDKDYFRKHIATGDYDLAIYSWPGTAYPATDARPIFAKPAAAADGSLLVEQNYTRVGTNQIDQLFDQASKELDDGARNDLIKRADARIWAAAGSVPLYQRPQLVAAGAKVANAGAFGFQTPRYQDIGFEKE
ncbi:hypothetical protein AN219_23435 [Streptomyces nanshensis]|nr:hypothetical protein AN219_23435 [Streptomyces nanshensis]